MQHLSAKYNKCDKCGKEAVGSGVMKTIKQNGKNYETKYYCCVVCLEDTKYSKKDIKNNGRKKTTDK